MATKTANAVLTKQVTPVIAKVVTLYRKLKQVEKRLKDRLSRHQASLWEYAGLELVKGNKVALVHNDKKLLTVSVETRSTLDKKRLAEDHPEVMRLIEEYTVSGEPFAKVYLH